MVEVLLIWALVASVFSFLLFGWDKRRAVRGGGRVSEATLLATALVGGFPGSWLAVRMFRHKSRKPSFLARLVLASLACSAAIWFLVRL